MARRRRRKVKKSNDDKYKWGMFFAAMIACICIVVLVLSLISPGFLGLGCRDGPLAGQAYAAIGTAGLDTDGEIVRLLITEPVVAEGNIACDFDNDGSFDETCMIEVDYRGRYTVTDVESGESKEQGSWLVGLLVYS